MPKAQHFLNVLSPLVPGCLSDDTVTLEPTPTTSGAFEVIVNDKLLHSKLQGQGYVDEAKLSQIADFIKAEAGK